MNLSQLITTEMTRQRLSYERLAELSHERRAGLSASYFCILVKRPLKSVSINMVRGVAAALSIPEETVAQACWLSLGYSVQRLSLTDMAPAQPQGECVVISTVGLSVQQALEVRRVAEDTKRRMEVPPDETGERDANPDSHAAVFSNGLPNPRQQPDHCDQHDDATSGPAKHDHNGVSRTQAAS